ncbi:TonB-dependent receptor plug domain-containing protein, partial [bacterium]|nr:TonB-dependent receptor plug domain-containing protein [bacterium]
MRSTVALTIALVLTIPFALLGQGTATISGKITDDEGNALPGANVLIQLTNMGAATNVDGEFQFTVPVNAVRGQEIKVEARFIGYHTQVKQITLTPGSHSVNFSLGLDALEMDAIIVTGVVEETPKAKLALSVGQVSKAQLDKVPAVSAEQAIRGKLAGVKVVQGNGEPGESASILLRAPTSINADGRSQQPLYIIDGVIIDPSITGSPMADIAAEDIESIEVVKGAAGASLYGSRAANGVINITTSRGTGLGIGETRIRFRSEYGVNKLGQKLPLNKSHHYRVASSSYVDANGISVEPGDFINADGDFVDPRAGTGRVIDTYIGFDQAPIQNQGTIAFADKPFKHKSTG